MCQVKELKEKIEELKGSDCLVANQKLIYSGKIQATLTINSKNSLCFLLIFQVKS
jgi:hypothetical protein